MTDREAFTEAVLKQAIEQMEGFSREEKKGIYQSLKAEYSSESLYTMIVSMVSVNLEEFVKLTKAYK